MNRYTTLGTFLHTVLLVHDGNTPVLCSQPSRINTGLSRRGRAKLRGINIQAELILIKEKRSGLPAATRKLILSTYGAPKQ